MEVSLTGPGEQVRLSRFLSVGCCDSSLSHKALVVHRSQVTVNAGGDKINSQVHGSVAMR